MLKSLDDAYDEAAIYDLKLSSNLNFSKSDVEEIKSVLTSFQINASVEGVKALDIEIFDSNKKSYVLNIETLESSFKTSFKAFIMHFIPLSISRVV